MNYTEITIPLIAGFTADVLIGDPYWLPHPVRFFGWLISGTEKRANNGKNRKLKGAVMTLGLVAVVYFFLLYLLKITSASYLLWMIVSSVLVFYGLANHSLIKESLKVISILKKVGLTAGRKQLSMIVGRDTSDLSENKIRIAVLETLAENLSDGVIAPIFYYLIGGIPGMFAYKMVNTLDSMIGYKNERFKDFGWFAARLDDVLNFIPARLTAFLMVLITFSYRGLKFIIKYGRKHNSPNAGYPEAALAGILNCRFGGPNIYHGVVVEKPFIGENNRMVSDTDIYKACTVNFFTALLVIISVVLFSFV